MPWIHRDVKDWDSRIDREGWGIQKPEEGFSKDTRISSLKDPRDYLVQPDHFTDREMGAWWWSDLLYCRVRAELLLEPRTWLSGQCFSHTHLIFMEMTVITRDYNKQRYVSNTLGWCQESLVTNIWGSWAWTEMDLTQRFNTYIPMFSTYLNSWSNNLKKEENG